jgi:hypothetical protein
MLTVIYAECHIHTFYAKRYYAECRYAECRGTLCIITKHNIFNQALYLCVRPGTKLEHLFKNIFQPSLILV